MNALPIDQSERLQALDTYQSFIVQAPAGSGKTYLLTQRYLKLLAENCSEPESILALTFTNKAANEMRARILTALKKAKENSFGPNEQMLAELAKKALERNDKLKWNILQNPHRLRIQTLDAFSLYLAQQLPITSRFGTATKITDSAQNLYQKAARQLLQSLKKQQISEALQNLVLHLENNYQRLETLLSDMLSHRDQWLPLLLQQQHSLREILNQNLAIIIEQIIVEAHQSIPKEIKTELLELLEFSLKQSFLPDTSIEQFSDWQKIAELFLTKDGSFRKTVNKNQGFPSVSDTKNPDEKLLFKEMKQKMENFLLNCSEKNYLIFKQNLHALQQAPDYPYRDEHFEIIEALFLLLPLLTAELMLIFKEQQCVDFIEIQQRALFALGDIDDPTDVTLKLDHKIEHVLIDEFQDTSISQFQLLQKITQGFIEGDGRTLFLVGDPMQSIYGFRAAEVGIFLQVKYNGIGNIKPTFLQLKTNFRSQSSLVKFYNEIFESAFPKQDNIHEGAISYAPSEAFALENQDNNGEIVQGEFDNEEQECSFIVEQIKQIQQQSPDDTIAILVQKRFYLKSLLPLLQQHQIHYQAVDIENLFEKSLIQDLYALTRAILFLHDRIAWLSILRAPWCGLTLNDLHSIASTDETILIWERIINHAALSITDDAKTRLNFIVPILAQALQQKQRYSLRTVVEQTWYKLRGDSCLTQLQELEIAEQFFSLLEQHEHAGDLLNLHNFEHELKKLYAGAKTVQSKLQIMTVHKSKGLEFDHVFLPFLNRKKKPADKKLLMWFEKFNTKHQRRYLIFAPFFSKHMDKEQQLQSFVKTHLDKKINYEHVRVIYVAYTRARKSLYLSATNAITDDNYSNEVSLMPHAKRIPLALFPAQQLEFETEAVSD